MMTGDWLLTTVVLLVTSATITVQLPSYLYRQSGRESPMKIRPKPCVSARGLRGQCMFVWDCIKGEGEHLGTCVDGFLFGSCCGHDAHKNVLADKSKPNSSTTRTTTTTSVFSDFDDQQLPVPQNVSVEVVVLREGIVNITDALTTSATPVNGHSNFNIPHEWTAVSAVLQMATGNDDGFQQSTERSTTRVPDSTVMLPIALHLTRTSTLNSDLVEIDFPTTTSSIPTITTTTTATTITPLKSKTTVRTKVRTTPTTVTPTEEQSTITLSLTTSAIERRTMETIAAPIMVPSKVFTDCGNAAILPQMRIVGGKDSRFGAWPWQVSVRRSTYFGFSSTHRCGGAILNENWVATAGHCVADLLQAQIRIRVGEYDLSSTDEPQPFVERSVQKKMVHPKYNADTYEYDLALIRLDKPLEPAQNIAPVCLPSGDPLLIGESATITGWGRLKEGGTLPSVLQEVRVPIVSNKKCEQMFMATGRREKIPNFFICAGFESGGKDSCQGDSGGPLQLKTDDGHWILAGIISWGIGCGESNLPGVCTRISKFREWILNKIDKEGA